MVTSNFDTKIEVLYPFTKPKLDLVSKEILTFKPDVERTVKYASAPTSSRKEVEAAAKPTQGSRVKALKDGFGELEVYADQLLDILGERARKVDLSLPVDPETNPVLAEAVWSLFKGQPRSVTFDMYKTLLEYEFDLGELISSEYVNA